MNIRTLVILLSVTGLPMAMLGCASANSATDSTVSFLRGDQKATLGATPQQVTDSALEAAKELELPVDAHAADGMVGKVLMHTANGTKVEVNVKAMANNESAVTIRVGTFGDWVLQQRMLDKIKSHLTAGAAVPVAAAAAPAVPPARVVPAATPTPPVAPALSPASPAAPAPANPLSPATVNPLSPGAAPATMPAGF